MTVAQRSRAYDAIADKGQTVSIAGASAGAYDVATGTVSQTAYSATGKAVILPLNPFRKTGNVNVKAGDEQMLLAGLATGGAALTQPPVDSVVTLADGTTKGTLVAIEPLAPAGLNIIYDCILRRSAA